VEVQLHTHKLSINLSTTVNGNEWSASCQVTPMLTEQVGTRTGMGTLE